jgi:hypothetical protein
MILYRMVNYQEQRIIMDKTEVIEITNRRADLAIKLEALNKTRLEFLHKQIVDRDKTIARLRAQLDRVESEMGLVR